LSSKQLPAPLRARMERAFGADFSAVTVHEDGAAGALGAEAYARGDALHFAPGRYDPDTPAGEELIAHELAHVVQQRRGRVAAGEGDGDVNGDLSLEREADQLAATAVAGGSAHVAHGTGTAGTGTAIQARFAAATSYDTTGRLPAYRRGLPTHLPARTPFECLGPVGNVDGQGTPGYEIRSENRIYYVAQAVADAASPAYQERQLPEPHAEGAPTEIADWDVGKRKDGGIVRGSGTLGTTLRTTVKWGPTVKGPCGTPEGTWMEATYLGPDHPRGSPDKLSPGRISVSTGVDWVGGHLLNDRLGGPGDDPRNIVAIPDTPTNTLHETKVESAVKTHVNINGGWAYYKVWAEHEKRDARSTVSARNARGRIDPRQKRAWTRAADEAGEPVVDEVNVAKALNTIWCKLDATGAPTETVHQDRFPIPEPLEIADVATDDPVAWHEPLPSSDAVGGPPLFSPSFFLSPISCPVSGHDGDYPSGRYNQQHPTHPQLKADVMEGLMRHFIEPGTRREPGRVLHPSASFQNVLTAEGYELDPQRDGSVTWAQPPPPARGRGRGGARGGGGGRGRGRGTPRPGEDLWKRHIRTTSGQARQMYDGAAVDWFVNRYEEAAEDMGLESRLATLSQTPQLQLFRDAQETRKRKRAEAEEESRMAAEEARERARIEADAEAANEEEEEDEVEEGEGEGAGVSEAEDASGDERGDGDGSDGDGEAETRTAATAPRPAKRARRRSGPRDVTDPGDAPSSSD
jgi:hypothetical protein